MSEAANLVFQWIIVLTSVKQKFFPVGIVNHVIELSEKGDVRKQSTNLQEILGHINNKFYNEYILALCERH